MAIKINNIIRIPNAILTFCNNTQPIYTLVYFRIAFGLLMCASVLRFMLKGWVYDLYIKPSFFFTYQGFDWIVPFSPTVMYAAFVLLAITSLFIALGLFYRISSTLFFLLFTYIELIDKSNYLNHYYFISLIAFLMCWVPANRYFSVDAYIKPYIKSNVVPNWTVGILKLQIIIVYFFAGVAKLNYDWLILAMPLKIWLPAKYDVPLLGQLLDSEWVAYAFSWAGMLFDISIPFFLIINTTRLPAYMLVIIFHTLTALLFPVIGMFPFIMIFAASIFLPSHMHKKVIVTLENFFSFIFSQKSYVRTTVQKTYQPAPQYISIFFTLYFLVQIMLPFRYLLYKGPLFWTEEGYRFSWRVMLMEKAGYITFSVSDSLTKHTVEIINSDFLTPQQEKMMSTQPDMILQFAHHLKNVYQKKNFYNPIVRAESYISINGRGSQLYVNPNVNLASISECTPRSKWLLPFEEKITNGKY
ncbi:MAG: HTTM domain-containing protein [Cytophagaceae bacterium]|nr:HTTM domain-containing protein [Cytophagaceae bacterium]MDW8456420.1 HTTM domain-containing protein [Cytophagaceae bacterium]